MFWVILIIVVIFIFVIIRIPTTKENISRPKSIIISTKNKNTLLFYLTGVHIEERFFWIINYCKPNDVLALEFEPDNIYDPNAIKVLHNDVLIGYVASEDTDEVSDFMKNYDYHAFIYKKDMYGKYLSVEIGLVEK